MRSIGPWMEMEDLVLAAKGRKVIFWGCFDFFEKTIKKHPFEVSHLVDINHHLHGKGKHHGYDVYDPSSLANLANKGYYFIIISSSAFYEIIDVLKDYGYRPGIDFAVTPLLNNFKVIADIFEIDTDIIFSSSDVAKKDGEMGGGLYTLNTKTQVFEKRYSGVTRGFFRYNDCWFIVDAQKGLCVADQTFQTRDCYKLPDGSVPHGIVIDEKKGIAYITLSIQDRIAVFDLETFKEIDSISLTNKYERGGRQYYCHHYNDLCLLEDTILISMFSQTGNLQQNWLNGCIIEYDLVERKSLGCIADQLWQPHSIKLINDSICFLDSMRGNMHLAAHMPETHFNGFIRGLDYINGYYFVGQSVHRYFDRMTGASNNISVDAGIYIYNPASKACRFVPTFGVRDINTLQILSD